MTRIASILSTVVAALALTGGALAVDGFSAGLGCSANCIKEAIVTPTASSATVAVKTDVLASVTATVTEQDVEFGLAAAPPAPKHESVPAFAMSRTILFGGLEPDTRYRIAVKARDQQGRINTRVGTFKTRAVQVAIDQPGFGFDSGAGCSAKCIQKALVRKHATQVGRVDFDIQTAVPAQLQLNVYRKNAQNQVVFQRIASRSTSAKPWKPVIDGLLSGTTYRVSLTAKDAKGRQHAVSGTFRTANATAIVTFHKMDVIDDGETGDGEIAFDYFVGDLYVGGNGYHKLGTGDTTAAYPRGTSRPTVVVPVSIDGLAELDVAVQGVECDNLRMKNCLTEVGHFASGEYDGDTYVMATAEFDLPRIASGDTSLPGNSGTGLPAGHDGYLVWENTAHDFKFRVYATIDLQVAS